MTAAWDKIRRPMDVRSGCLGKARYPSLKYARSAMRALRQTYPGAYASTVRPYRCPECKHWHVGTGW